MSPRGKAGAPTPEEAFGRVMRSIRRQRGLSQEALSFACERHRTYVSLIERGENSPSLRTLFRIAAALKAKPSQVLACVEAAVGEHRFDTTPFSCEESPQQITKKAPNPR